VIGLLSDSQGDLEAFEAAFQLLRAKGAKRFFFNGGRYEDLDDWCERKRQASRGLTGPADPAQGFLDAVSGFLQTQAPKARGAADDDLDDAALLPGFFVRTPERGCPAFSAPDVSRKVVDMLGDVLCCIVHNKNDLDRDDMTNSAIFFHGDSPEPKVVQIGPRFFVTPGKLSGAAQRTCGLIETVERSLVFSAFTLDGQTVIDRQPIALERKRNLTVK
jgi:hypothetical protein